MNVVFCTALECRGKGEMGNAGTLCGRRRKIGKRE
jgi:hypothetical protein